MKVPSGVSSSGRGVRGGGLVELYRPPPMRQRQLEQQREKELQSSGKHKAEPPLSPPPREPPKAATVSETMVVDNRMESDYSSSKPSVVSPFAASPLSMLGGNLERFLKSITPTVPARYSSQCEQRNGEIGELSKPYFKLGDLWESFKEWSAYGAGVPLVLNGGDSVIQYYVPFLSAIQLYPCSSRPNPTSRPRAEENDDDNYQDTSSDISSESETEQIIGIRRRDGSQAGQEGSYSDDGQASAHPQLPLFEYLERDPPYRRQPLADKISVLASKFPDLITYRSCDLLSSSWMSVAWYPIYRIPIGSQLQDLDACFLTFHMLTDPSKRGTKYAKPNNPCMDEKISLPVFGLASYKFRGSVWISNQNSEQDLPSSLLQAAEKWLQLRHVDHPDFRFFINHHNISLK